MNMLKAAVVKGLRGGRDAKKTYHWGTKEVGRLRAEG